MLFDGGGYKGSLSAGEMGSPGWRITTAVMATRTMTMMLASTVWMAGGGVIEKGD